MLLPILVMSFFLGSFASYSKAPESKSNEAKMFSAPADKGTVYIYRTGRAFGSAGQLMVTMNSRDTGETGPGTFFRWDLNPGTYMFSSSTAESSALVQLDMQAGQVYFIRQDVRLGIEKGRFSRVEVVSKKGRMKWQIANYGSARMCLNN